MHMIMPLNLCIFIAIKSTSQMCNRISISISSSSISTNLLRRPWKWTCFIIIMVMIPAVFQNHQNQINSFWYGKFSAWKFGLEHKRLIRWNLKEKNTHKSYWQCLWYAILWKEKTFSMHNGIQSIIFDDIAKNFK